MYSFIRRIYVRNNFFVVGDGWEEIQFGQYQDNCSLETLVSECSFQIAPNYLKLDETDDTNNIRMFSEIKVTETHDGGTEKQKFVGIIDSIKPGSESYTIHCLDPLGMAGKKYVDLGDMSADILKITDPADNHSNPGDPDDPSGLPYGEVKLVPITENGEIRYIPDYSNSAFDSAYIGDPHPPTFPYNNRRTWAAVGILRDYHANITQYPDHIVPLSYYRIGTDLLNYMEFLGWDPTHALEQAAKGPPEPPYTPDIRVEFICVYVEGTNQIEDIVIAMLQLPAPDGLGYVEGTHFDSTSSDYYVKTIWPSLITVNKFGWKITDGSLLDGFQSLLEQFAPPNFKLFFDHEYGQIRLQYIEQIPHSITTPYYTQGSYAYGGISPDVPPFNNSIITRIPTSGVTTYPRDEITFNSEIITVGVNEWPENVIKEIGVFDDYAAFAANDYVGCLLITPANAILLDLPSEYRWGAGWEELTGEPGGASGTPDDLVDKDMKTHFGMVWPKPPHDSMPPQTELNKYYPTYLISFGLNPITDKKIIERIRFYGAWSRKPWQYGTRFEVCDDWNPANPLLSASWQPLAPSLFDRMYDPFELVDVSSGWFRDAYSHCLIWMRPEKAADRVVSIGAFIELEFVEHINVLGTAKIVNVSSTPSDIGRWFITEGVGTDDGLYELNMPKLYDQLALEPVAGKYSAGHRAAVHKNASVPNTNLCALEAARILLETVREKRQVGAEFLSPPDVSLYKTIQLADPTKGLVVNALIEVITKSDADGTSVDCTNYLPSSWTGETPQGLSGIPEITPLQINLEIRPPVVNPTNIVVTPLQISLSIKTVKPGNI